MSYFLNFAVLFYPLGTMLTVDPFPIMTNALLTFSGPRSVVPYCVTADGIRDLE